MNSCATETRQSFQILWSWSFRYLLVTQYEHWTWALCSGRRGWVFNPWLISPVSVSLYYDDFIRTHRYCCCISCLLPFYPAFTLSEPIILCNKSLLVFLLKLFPFNLQSLIDWGCFHSHGCIVIYWKVSSWLVATLLKKTTSYSSNL